MIKTAVFGGAFNPPHAEHILIAKNAAAELGLEKLVFLPSNNPPHKKITTTAVDRLEMLRLATKDFENCEICEFEINNSKVNYTLNTLDELQRLYGDFYFIIGGDSLVDIKGWYKPEQVVKKAKLVVFMREGIEDKVLAIAEELKSSFNANIKIMDYLPKGVSSTVLRQKLLTRQDCSKDISDSVLSYIAEKKLYADYDFYLDKLSEFVLPKTYKHIIRSVNYALKLNEKLKLDERKVIISQLLHDVAKQVDNFSYEIPKNAIGTPVAHAFMAEQVAKKDFDITDKEVLQAIRLHCTGGLNMSKLDKLVYCADMLEDGRTFEGVEELREIIENDFEKGFVECLKASYTHLLENEKAIYPLTEMAFKYYCI